jgi:hypothetical protein
MNPILINPNEYDLEDAGVPQTLFAFDMDSVLLNLSFLRPMLCAWFKITMDELVESCMQNGRETFDFNIPGVSNNQLYKAVHELVREHSPSALPNPFMQDTLRYYHELTGDPIVVVTARHRDNTKVTEAWLTENLDGLPFVAIICHGKPKHEVLVNQGCYYFVDDRYKTVDGLHGYIMHPVLYQQPWNQGRDREASSLQIRDLRDLIPIFNIECGLPPARWPGNIPYPDRVGRGKVVDLYA